MDPLHPNWTGCVHRATLPKSGENHQSDMLYDAKYERSVIFRYRDDDRRDAGGYGSGAADENDAGRLLPQYHR
jgi:hypothetical protein